MSQMPRLQHFHSPLFELFIQRNFLNRDECAGLIARINAHRRPSAAGGEANDDPSIRTNESCDLSTIDPFVRDIDLKICAFAGIHPNCSEQLQGQRYAVGQEYKQHWDFYLPGSIEFKTYCSVADNRTWTYMVYLNRPSGGGSTRFTHVDKTITPETGKLIFWNNRLADGGVNEASMHRGMKVHAGTKYIITKWFREGSFH